MIRVELFKQSVMSFFQILIKICLTYFRLSNLVLRGRGGHIVALSPTMPDNSSSEPYTVEFAGYSTCGIQFKSSYILFLLLSQQKFKRDDFDNFQPMMWSVRRSRKLESSSTKFSRWTRSRKRSSQSWELSKNGLTVQYFFSIHF